jgi:hypothetical protein
VYALQQLWNLWGLMACLLSVTMQMVAWRAWRFLQKRIPTQLAQPLQSLDLDLADTFAGQPKPPTDFFQCICPAVPDAEMHA